jgi:hypothetical protein
MTTKLFFFTLSPRRTFSGSLRDSLLNLHHPLFHSPEDVGDDRSRHLDLVPAFLHEHDGQPRGKGPHHKHTQTTTPIGRRRPQRHASLVHDTGLANGRHAKRHATLPTGARDDLPHRSIVLRRQPHPRGRLLLHRVIRVRVQPQGHHQQLRAVRRRGVAVQVGPFELKGYRPEFSILKFSHSKAEAPVFHFIGSQGLKPYAFKLWVSTGFNLYIPPPRQPTQSSAPPRIPPSPPPRAAADRAWRRARRRPPRRPRSSCSTGSRSSGRRGWTPRCSSTSCV